MGKGNETTATTVSWFLHRKEAGKHLEQSSSKIASAFLSLFLGVWRRARSQGAIGGGGALVEVSPKCLASSRVLLSLSVKNVYPK